ncbi:MAG: putative peptidoglycan glycosyltransferase FtsW [bacterium]
MTRNRKIQRKKSGKVYSPDYTIILLTVMFLLFGLIMIFDASIYKADEVFNDRFHFVIQQVIWVIVGTVVAAVFYFWDYHSFSKLALPAVIVSIVLLIVVLFVGTEVNGSKRWFLLGPVPIQPAEFAKLAFILYLASWLSKEKKYFKHFRDAWKHHFWQELLTFLFVLLSICGLIILEPDLGTTIVIAMSSFVIYFSSGKDFVHLIGTFLIVLVGGILGTAAALLESYRLERVKTYLQLLLTGEVADPRGTGYQIQQILIGIGSGGFWGKGFGQSRQRFGYLVENTAFTDSIYAIILEEMGMLGGLVLISLFILFFLRAYQIAKNSPDKLGSLLAGGIGFWLVFQAFVHMGANVAMMPLTGVPLPFFTYGGSSTVVALAGVGMLLNVSKYAKK